MLQNSDKFKNLQRLPNMCFSPKLHNYISDFSQMRVRLNSSLRTTELKPPDSPSQLAVSKQVLPVSRFERFERFEILTILHPSVSAVSPSSFNVIFNDLKVLIYNNLLIKFPFHLLPSKSSHFGTLFWAQRNK